MHRRTQGGFSLIEILVTLLITAMGMLGLVALQARAQQAQLESYQRAQAMILVQEIIGRLTANLDARDCYEITVDPTSAATSNYVGVNGTAAACSIVGGTGLPATQATNDINTWDAMLLGAAETSGVTNVGGLINARGCITKAQVDVTEPGGAVVTPGGIDQFTVSVSWQGLYDSIVPTANCANGTYGTDTSRRTISMTVEFGDLG